LTKLAGLLSLYYRTDHIELLKLVFVLSIWSFWWWKFC